MDPRFRGGDGLRAFLPVSQHLSGENHGFKKLPLFFGGKDGPEDGKDN